MPPQDLPRPPQDPPRALQETPKTPKMPPRDPKIVPRDSYMVIPLELLTSFSPCCRSPCSFAFQQGLVALVARHPVSFLVGVALVARHPVSFCWSCRSCRSSPCLVSCWSCSCRSSPWSLLQSFPPSGDKCREDLKEFVFTLRALHNATTELARN